MQILRSRRLLVGAVVAGAVTTLAVASAGPAGAQSVGTSQDRPAAQADAGQASLRAALERDLGVTGAELDELLAASAAATELDGTLREQLGADYAGSWFDAETGTLTVAVADGRATRLATAAGAQSRLVERGGHELQAIVEELNDLVEADPGALDGVVKWSFDAPSNQVVVTAREAALDEIDAQVAEYGDAVRVETAEVVPQLTQAYPFLDGGIPYNGCSTGFNVASGTTGYFLTAGHCGTAGTTAVGGNGVTIGPFVESFFPTFDDAIVRVDNTGFWVQGPWVFTWPGFVTVNGLTDAPVGTPMCKSGRTTGLTCGTITVKDVTVNYAEGTVFGLTEHNACVEPGDSGGSNLNVSGGIFAEGMTSGAVLSGGQCLGRFGQASISWYQPIADSLAYYGAQYGVTLLTG